MFLLLAPTTEEAALSSTPTATASSPLTKSVSVDDIDLSAKPPLYIGNKDAKITLVEYGDFKCPSCNRFMRQAGAQIRSSFIDQGDVKIEFRNFPVIGPDSGRAARGAYCANAQDNFAIYHDKTYEYIWDNFYGVGNLSAEFEDVLSEDVLVEIVTGVVDDTELFRACLRSTEFDDSVDTDLSLAKGDGITGIPGFIIGGRKILGPQSFNTFKTLIDIELR